MSLFKKLAGETAIYGLSSMLGRMLNYVLVPFYTAIFTSGEYGIVTEFYAYIAFLNILFIYGLETAYFRFASQEKEKKYFNIAISSILSTSIVLSGLIIFFSGHIAVLLNYPDKGTYITWLACILAIDAIVAIPFAQLRLQKKAVRFVIFKLSFIGSNIGFNLFFIVFCPWFLEGRPDHWLNAIYIEDLGVGYVFLSNLLSNLFYVIFFIPTWLNVSISFDLKEWKKMIQYAWPMLIIGFASVTNEMLSRAILKYRLPESYYDDITNQEALGIFGACYKLSIFMSLAVQAFRYAFEPFFFSNAGDKNSTILFSKVMTGFVIFTSFSWLLISLALPYIAPVLLRQDEYLQALDTVPWLLGGGLFLGVYYNLSIWYKSTDKTIYGAYISLVGAAFTFLLNWVLIPVMGYMGSAITTLITYLCMAIISFLWGRRYYRVPYEIKKLATYVMMATVGIIVNAQLGPSITNAVIIILFFLILLFIFERKTIRFKA